MVGKIYVHFRRKCINHYEKAVSSNMEAKGVMKETGKMFLKMKRDTLVAESSAK